MYEEAFFDNGATRSEITRERALTSRYHSQKKHLGYENLADDPESGEHSSKTDTIFVLTLLFA